MPGKIDISKFDRKISFCRVTSGKTGMGGPSKLYTHAFYMWMSREQLAQGQEQYVNNRLVIPTRYIYRGHYNPAINISMQLLDGDPIGNQGNQWGQIKYNIVSIDPIERNMFIEIVAERIAE
jgi:hypothetical protein